MDGRLKRFTFRLTPQERAMIDTLAERMRRSPSDAIRVVLRAAHKHMTQQEEEAPVVQLTRIVHPDGDRAGYEIKIGPRVWFVHLDQAAWRGLRVGPFPHRQGRPWLREEIDAEDKKEADRG